MNGLGLFMMCLNDGLPMIYLVPIISKLSGLTNDVTCVNTQQRYAKESPNMLDDESWITIGNVHIDSCPFQSICQLQRRRHQQCFRYVCA
jgi:hypothetical protein